jgi:hypothetical protein
MFRNQSKRFWIILIGCVTAFVFYFPSLVAFRYTAPPQNVTFLYQPWKSWSFAYTALTVPADAELKTSGEALRTAEKIWPEPQFNTREVRVLFLAEGEPHTFTNEVLGDEVKTTITPTYDFVWQVRGWIGRDETDTVLGLLDYRTGDVIYDVRSDLGSGAPETTAPAPATSPSPTVDASYGP